MKRSNRPFLGLAGALLIAVGCDSTGGAPPVSSSTEEATVRGTVTLKGQPAVGATIYFDPSNVHRKVGPRSAAVGPNGSYEVKTLLGGNNVSVHSKAIDADNALSTNSRLFEVQAGENTLPIELP